MPNDQNRSLGNDDTIRMNAVSHSQRNPNHTAKRKSQPPLTEAQREAALRARRAQRQNRARLEQQAQMRASEEMQHKQLQAQKKKEAEDAHAMKAYRDNQARQAEERQAARLEVEEAQRQAEAKEAAKRVKKQAKKDKQARTLGLFKKTDKEKKEKVPKQGLFLGRQKEEKPKKKRKGMGCLAWLVLFFVMLGVAFGALWMFRSHQTVTPLSEIPVSERAAVAAERERQNVYLLFAGTDAREDDEAARSDTIIYTVFRQADRKVEMVSIPRDTLVDIPEYESGKINSALAYGGMDLLINTVENFLDSPIDHTVLIDFSSFEDIVDAMGGIKMDVPEKMYLPEEGIDLEPGNQKLNGHDALAFVRWRGDGTGDLGRIQRQSQFMSAVMAKMTHLTPWAAVRTAITIRREVKTDMSLGEMLGLAWSFIGMDGSDLEYQAFNVDATYINGVSFVLIDSSEVNRVVQTMRYGAVLDELAYMDDNESYDYSGDTYAYDNGDAGYGYETYDNSYNSDAATTDNGGYDNSADTGYDNAGADTGGGMEAPAADGGAGAEGGEPA